MTVNLPRLPAVREALNRRFPFSVEPRARRYEPGSVALGRANNEPLALPRRPRHEHCHVIGTTGGGKTNLLEHMIRQDIKNGDGVCVIDPHGSHPGSMYRSLIAWLFAGGYHKSRTIHLIDPNCPDFTTGFNPLELPDPQTSPSVVAGTALEAIERVWEGENTHSKPTIRRLLKATFAALAELHLTMAEAELLFDHHDSLGMRAYVIRQVSDRYARTVFTDLDQLAKADRTGMRFRDEVVGPLNRLAEFTSAPAIRRIIGQRRNTIDLCAALDEGHVILVNLAGGDAVNDADCELLGRLLTRFLFFHIKRRATEKSFWFYLDECQRYLSGDIPSLLAEARKFRTGVVLSHQWQSQLGKEDDQTLAAVHNATNLKIGFRIKHPKEAMEIAECLIPLNLEMPVNALIKPTVVGHRRTWFESRSETDSESWGSSETASQSETVSDTEGESSSETLSDSHGWSAGTSLGQTLTGSYEGPIALGLPDQISIATSRGSSSGRSGGSGTSSAGGSSSSHSTSTTTGTATTESYSRGHAETRGASEGLEPLYENLPSAVHSYQNALYFAAQMLRTLSAGEAFASFVDRGGLHSVRLNVPRVKSLPVKPETFTRIRTLLFSRSPSAIEMESANAQLQERENELQIAAHKQPEPNLDPTEPENFRVSAPSNRKGQRRSRKQP